ncbi:GtrA family protein [Lacticaseibacillus sp. 53-4]|uniref:GtrA family protein n=1 Tax=Lacticaseibacillus sp. 53-4 TaxID=2799575 RepID=UPI00194157A4|nr:GtrA family protein [Lacticaseibacillus sp. 53-4]
MITIFKRVKQALVAKRLWDILTYIFFGGLTTVINIVVFGLSTRVGLNWQIANFIAWLLSVLFAFVTNKLWVFNSHTENFTALLWEFIKFMFARVVSLGIDYACMFLFINAIGWSSMVAKILTQIVIIVANYAFSKFIIFRHKPSDRA